MEGHEWWVVLFERRRILEGMRRRKREGKTLDCKR